MKRTAIALALACSCASSPPRVSEAPPIIIVIAPPPVFKDAPPFSSTKALASDELVRDWIGVWEGDNGHKFSFKLHLEPRGKDRKDLEGWFEFTLTHAPPESRLTERIGDSGREFVRGRWDPPTRMLTLNGYRVDAPGLLAIDAYRIQISASGMALEGTTRGNSYNWTSTVRGRASR
jgi:hypothetical protein